MMRVSTRCFTRQMTNRIQDPNTGNKAGTAYIYWQWRRQSLTTLANINRCYTLLANAPPRRLGTSILVVITLGMFCFLPTPTVKYNIEVTPILHPFFLARLAEYYDSWDLAFRLDA